jgi:PPOX class probable F420-dependent enzyme
MATLSGTQQALLKAQNFAVVATVGEDGSPQSTVVWIDTDGENVVFNTKRGRAKVAHLEGDPRVSVTIMDAGDPYRFFEVQGVASLDEEDAGEHINELSIKYTGSDFSDLTGRVIVRVRPERVLAYNVD